MRRVGLVLLGLMLLSSSVWAASASRTINYQGRVTDLSGSPVPDGTHSIVVSLYDVVTGGTAKWTDSFTSVSTKNGFFNILLGSGTQNLNALDFSVQYYIGVRVDSDSEMSPRQPLSGVPYAMNIEVPVGTIMAWHKTLYSMSPNPTTIPPLPANFVECSGQTLDDLESPFHGKVIPDLNGQGRFLRGNTTSGTVQSDQMQGHKHILGTRSYQVPQTSPTCNVWSPQALSGDIAATSEGASTDGTNGTPRTGAETRPVNMSVVWIMRIK